MCTDLLIRFECFCDSRIIETVIINNKASNINNNQRCQCFKVKSFKILFSWCYVCNEKIIRNRNKLKKILLSCQRNDFFNMYYHNSVSFFVQREIKI